jgi:hypothetical protein
MCAKKVAKRWLQKHPESCKLPVQREQATRSPKGGRLPGEQHEHGSENCISAFHGREKWSRSMKGDAMSGTAPHYFWADAAPNLVLLIRPEFCEKWESEKC